MFTYKGTDQLLIPWEVETNNFARTETGQPGRVWFLKLATADPTLPLK